MNPNLNYAQAIPGICIGRGIGIIDTLHLIDIPFAIEILKFSNCMNSSIYQGLKSWFKKYLEWLLADEKGITEMNEKNNHSVAFFVQAAVFALFTDNAELVDFCRDAYKHSLIL